MTTQEKNPAHSSRRRMVRNIVVILILLVVAMILPKEPVPWLDIFGCVALSAWAVIILRKWRQVENWFLALSLPILMLSRPFSKFLPWALQMDVAGKQRTEQICWGVGLLMMGLFAIGIACESSLTLRRRRDRKALLEKQAAASS